MKPNILIVTASDGNNLKLANTLLDISKEFEASFESAMAHVQAQLQRYHIPVLPLDTVDAVAQQLHKHLGSHKGQP